MTRDVSCCTESTPLSEVARMMLAADCGAIPVIDGDSTRQPIGIVTDRDIVCRTLAAGKEPLNMTARDCMSGPCVTVDMNATLGDCRDLMEANMIRRLVVIDDDNRCIGIVATADIASRSPEELTGEIVKTISQRQPHEEARPI
jgi:CBS domain-containing protein